MLLNYFGAFTHMFEVTYDDNFIYPYTEKCQEIERSKFRVVYIIKSAVQNFDRRMAIRKSWGFEKRFFDVPSRTVFLLGVHSNDEEVQAKVKLEATKYKDIIQVNFIDEYYNNTIKTMIGFKWAVEYCSNSKFYMFVDDDMYVSVKNVLRFIRNPANYPDYLKEPKKISQKREIKYSYQSHVSDVNFTYGSNLLNNNNEKIKPNIGDISDPNNHTQKELLSTVESVHLSDAFSDTQENVIDKKYITENHPTTILNNHNKDNKTKSPIRKKRQVFDFELPEDVRLYAGFVFVSSPHRHRSSKWYVSLEEYPFHLWPPYVSAGAYVVSREALLDMYYTSFYTKHFRFDDIFLGLVAKKADIEPFHCEEFHFYKKDYTKFNYKYVVTSHGYEDPNELLRVWNEQKALGNA
ncbi:hypothetical protein KPH14_005429 [Odynerus spinipes]|uniref:Hexosyltransferase n=1 Tax=Odynerus spinipes TaxID=1348599 RepID=A0AAD9RD26_9HYME|nr:hypothetical protein KPH14_005429 [Odynerus spinipes]